MSLEEDGLHELRHMHGMNARCRGKLRRSGFSGPKHFKNSRAAKKDTLFSVSFFLEVPPRFELGSGAFAELCLTTWLWHLIKYGAKRSLLRNWSE